MLTTVLVLMLLGGGAVQQLLKWRGFDLQSLLMREEGGVWVCGGV